MQLVVKFEHLSTLGTDTEVAHLTSVLVNARVLVHSVALVGSLDGATSFGDVRRLHELGILPMAIACAAVVVTATEISAEQLGRVDRVPAAAA